MVYCTVDVYWSAFSVYVHTCVHTRDLLVKMGQKHPNKQNYHYQAFLKYQYYDKITNHQLYFAAVLKLHKQKQVISITFPPSVCSIFLVSFLIRPSHFVLLIVFCWVLTVCRQIVRGFNTAKKFHGQSRT